MPKRKFSLCDIGWEDVADDEECKICGKLRDEHPARSNIFPFELIYILLIV